MAQVGTKTCDICTSALSEFYCTDCEQYFCGFCKSLHKRQTGTKNHVFQSSLDVIPEVKSKCKEHNEDFIFLCSGCEVPVCRKCIAGKHNGHNVADIDDSVTVLTKSIQKAIDIKLNVANQNLMQIECGIKDFDTDIYSIINGIIKEARKMKSMIDRTIQRLIDDINNKTKQEREKLTKIIVEAQMGLEKGKLLEQKGKELNKTRHDVTLLQKLKTLNSDISMFEVVTVPLLPSIRYTPKLISEQNLLGLFGTYSVSETHSMENTPWPTYNKETRSEEQQGIMTAGKLYRCNNCGHEKIVPIDRYG
ncbi:E3 ubiquitin-protein ligase TRIM71-like [Mytilus californianus]|uniref:E3 ubiquitin-protein ligase TRIM71-like n=1 Tax=Mytilus californianus TaxID=6549 RepID=UPI0022450DBE|nr:E3 ubiquitin-protein ligase TRIM71-like [Mytilus californianus]